MNHDLPYDLLLEKALEDSDKASRRLGELIQAQSSCQQQLDTLLQYREEYISRWQEASRSGVDGTLLLNFHRFLAKLDAAVEQQREKLGLAEEATEQGRDVWKESHRKLKSFDTLRERQQAASELRTVRREQRDSDEFAQRAHGDPQRSFSAD